MIKKSGLKFILSILLIGVVSIGFAFRNKEKTKKQISVLSLNIWQEGTKVDGGYDAIVNEITRLQPDFVTLSEVRNYKNTRFCDRITQSLKEQGLDYYSFYSDDCGLLSRYPISDSLTIFPLINDHGSIYKLKTKVDGVPFAVYTAHLDYLNCAYYLPRGYCGNTWEKLKKPVTDKHEIEKMNVASKRDDAILNFIKDANQEFENGATILLGGDFNEPSFMDWTEQTKDLYDHNGLVYNWTVTALLAENGYIDSYREMYPSAIENPGFTYPSSNMDKPIKELTWAPSSDERERIDFIFYKTPGSLSLKSIKIVGPNTSIKKGEVIIEATKDEFIEPLGVWPTDHKGLFAVFEW
ncbi:MAG: endonuclease/exonuclease/phosphatase family protein [Marinilabiliaceae bacterium]|nr:endonuclease/exonuclease/phosphatase family protein [Marinilabiliaceae bacterium]